MQPKPARRGTPGWSIVLRLPYLALTSVSAFIRLLPTSDKDKDIEILTLRHQLAILQRRTDKPRPTGRTSPPSCTGCPAPGCGSST
jgi:hypothetical protein